MYGDGVHYGNIMNHFICVLFEIQCKYLLSVSIRALYGFSQQYILMTDIPMIISFIM